MRVLLTTDTVGGVWTFTRELARELLRAGHAVAMAGFGGAASPAQRSWFGDVPGEFLYEESGAPLEWTQGNERTMDGEGLLHDLIGRFRPDVMHASQFCFGSLPVDLPRVVTAHSDVLSWGEACRAEGFADAAWMRQYRRLVGDGLAGADAVVAPTAWMLEALRSNFSLPDRHMVIANGVSLDPAFAGERKLQAVTAGRMWDEGKGLDLLENFSSPLPLVVAGETGGRAFSAGENVRFCGPLDERALLTLFAESSVYVVTSRYEPFGLAAVEAALCGCAVVANDLPSLREVWGDGAVYFCGRGHEGATAKANADLGGMTASVQAGAPQLDGLGAVLGRLCAEPELLIAARARSLARAKQFTVGRMADEYLVVYADAVNMRAEKATVYA